MENYADGFQLNHYYCHAGPADPVFEEQHIAPMIALVCEGRFTYHGEHGTRLAETGSLLLGNGGRNYACSHEDSRGDRCMVLQFEPELFAEAAASHAGSSWFTFTNSTLPACEAMLPHLLRAERGETGAAIGLLESVLGLQSGYAAAPAEPNRHERRAVRLALDLAETKLTEVLALAELASYAGMSKYHFIRCFKRVIGTSPYRYLLTRRMQRAARLLSETESPVTAIAFDCGFGDLSTFNARFRAVFGMAPTVWRKITG
jgi:AraC family transcriptional regulator